MAGQRHAAASTDNIEKAKQNLADDGRLLLLAFVFSAAPASQCVYAVHFVLCYCELTRTAAAVLFDPLHTQTHLCFPGNDLAANFFVSERANF